MSAHRALHRRLAGITLMAGLLLAGCGSAATPTTASGTGRPVASPVSGAHKAAAHHTKARPQHIRRVQGTVTAITPSSVTIAPASGSAVTVAITPRTRVWLAPSGSKTKAKITTLLAVTKGAKVVAQAIATPKAMRAVRITVA